MRLKKPLSTPTKGLRSPRQKQTSYKRPVIFLASRTLQSHARDQGAEQIHPPCTYYRACMISIVLGVYDRTVYIYIHIYIHTYIYQYVDVNKQ